MTDVASAARPQTIGDMQVLKVSDGILHATYDPFRGIAREDCVRLVGRPDEGAGSVPIDVNAFVVKRDGKTILIDAGSSNTMGPTLGKLPENLRANGIDPAAIDHVLITHVHPDHANGLVDADNQPVFPNAEVIVHDVDARFWLDRETDTRDSDFVRRSNSAARRVLGPYLDRLRRVTDGEVLPGISAHIQPGHSPGHTGFLVQSGNEAVLFFGDIIHVAAIQLPNPEAYLIYDLEPEGAVASRRRVLDWVSGDRIRVAGAHLDGPSIGFITRRGSGFAFEPG